MTQFPTMRTRHRTTSPQPETSVPREILDTASKLNHQNVPLPLATFHNKLHRHPTSAAIRAAIHQTTHEHLVQTIELLHDPRMHPCRGACRVDPTIVCKACHCTTGSCSFNGRRDHGFRKQGANSIDGAQTCRSHNPETQMASNVSNSKTDEPRIAAQPIKTALRQQSGASPFGEVCQRTSRKLLPMSPRQNSQPK